jgi:hypothetical protein
MLIQKHEQKTNKQASKQTKKQANNEVLMMITIIIIIHAILTCTQPIRKEPGKIGTSQQISTISITPRNN